MFLKSSIEKKQRNRVVELVPFKQQTVKGKDWKPDSEEFLIILMIHSQFDIKECQQKGLNVEKNGNQIPQRTLKGFKGIFEFHLTFPYQANRKGPRKREFF